MVPGTVVDISTLLLFLLELWRVARSPSAYGASVTEPSTPRHRITATG